MNVITEKLKKLNFVNIIVDENATPTTNVHNVTPNKKIDFEKQGMDFDEMLVSIQQDELYQSISKTIFNDISNSSTKTTDINIDAILIEMKRDDKITEIFDEEKVKRPAHSNIQNASTILRDNLYNICDKIKPNVIITNGRIGSSITDFYEFISNSHNVVVSNGQYPIGEIFGCEIFVDAYMSYMDDRIFIANVDLDFFHNDKLIFNDDFSELTYGYDIKLNPSSKVEVLNIIDNDMLLM